MANTDSPSSSAQSTEIRRPRRWMVMATVLGALAILGIGHHFSGASRSADTGTFLAVFGVFFALAGLTGLLSPSPAIRWLCLAWAPIATVLLLGGLWSMDEMERLGFIRCGNTLLPAMAWTVFVPPVLAFLAWRHAARSHRSVEEAFDDS